MMKMPKDYYDPPAPAQGLMQTSYPGVRVPWDEPAQKPWTYQTGAFYDAFSGTWVNPDGTRRRNDDTVVADPYQIKALETPEGYYNHVQVSEPLGDPPKKDNTQPYLEYNSGKPLPPIDSKFRNYDGAPVDPSNVNVQPSLAQQKEFPDLDKKSNEPPYLKHEHDTNIAPLGSKFRSYNGQWYDPSDNYTPVSLA